MQFEIEAFSFFPISFLLFPLLLRLVEQHEEEDVEKNKEMSSDAEGKERKKERKKEERKKEEKDKEKEREKKERKKIEEGQVDLFLSLRYLRKLTQFLPYQWNFLDRKGNFLNLLNFSLHLSQEKRQRTGWRLIVFESLIRIFHSVEGNLGP